MRKGSAAIGEKVKKFVTEFERETGASADQVRDMQEIRSFMEICRTCDDVHHCSEVVLKFIKAFTRGQSVQLWR